MGIDLREDTPNRWDPGTADRVRTIVRVRPVQATLNGTHSASERSQGSWQPRSDHKPGAPAYSVFSVVLPGNEVPKALYWFSFYRRIRWTPGVVASKRWSVPVIAYIFAGR